MPKTLNTLKSERKWIYSQGKVWQIDNHNKRHGCCRESERNRYDRR